MFGQPTFGQASTSTAFGQSSFGKPAFSSTGFGATGNSLFGQPAAQQPTTSLFGNTQPQTSFGTGGLFGSQPQTSNTGTSLFGNPPAASTSTSGGLFGTSTSAFGQNKPAFGGFGNTSSGGLFGQSSMFGQNNQAQPTTSLFGGTNTAYGSMSSGTTIKFNPVTSTDTMMKSGSSTTINTRHQCITCMKEYENKSIEELRFEDYAAKRKGVQQGVQPTGSFFGSAQPSLFGTNTSAPQSTSSLFGAQQTATTAASSLFGQTSTSSFGQTTNTFGANNSLFGKPSTGFGTPISTQSSTFSFNPTNMFGQSNTATVKPFGAVAPQTNSLFGTSTAQPTSTFGTTQNTGFGGFGTMQNQPLNFNQNKPAFSLGNTTSSGFGFGTNTATNNTSLFGAKPATNTFGQPAVATPFGATSTSFGAQPAQTSNLFGNSFNKPPTAFQFNQNPATNTSIGGNTFGGTSLFGNTAAKPTGSLFGNTTNTGGGMFGNSTFGTNTSSSFGQGLNTGFNLGGSTNPSANSSLFQPPPSVPQSVNTQQVLNLTSSSYFGDPALYKGIVPNSGTNKLDDLVLPSIQKNRVNSNNLTISPNTTYKVKFKSVGSVNSSTKSLFDGLTNDTDDSEKYFNMIKSNPKRLVLTKKNRSSLDLNSMTSNQSQTVVQDTTSSNVSSPLTPVVSTPISSRSNTSNKEPSLHISSHLAEAKENISPVEITNLKITKPSSDSGASSSPEKNEAILDFKLTKKGYYVKPTLEALREMKKNNTGPCTISNFTIGREEFGEVCFTEPFDITELNNLDLDKLVDIVSKQVVIYPDDTNKPPVGSGLNRPAKVTLLKVWPADKTTGAYITDVQKLKDMDYESRLSRACRRMSVEYVNYVPETGAWIFNVPHFSKYGLLESDEEGEPETKAARTSLVSSVSTAKYTRSAPMDSPVQFVKDIMTPSPKQKLRNEILVKEMNRSYNQDNIAKAALHIEETMDHFESSTEALARNLGTNPFKVQLMKQYFDDTFDNSPFSAGVSKEFFFENKSQVSRGPLLKLAGQGIQTNVDLLQSIERIMSPSSELDKESSISEEDTVIIKLEHKLNRLDVLPVRFNQCRLSSILSKQDSRNIFNMEHFWKVDRKFHVTWLRNKRTILATCYDYLMPEKYADACGLFDPPHLLNNQMCVIDTCSPPYNGLEASLLQNHLQVSLANVSISLRGSTPYAELKLGNTMLSEHCNLVSASASSSYEQQVWKLCVALWGTIENKNHSHDINMKRKNNLSEWLESLMANTDKGGSKSVEEDIFQLVAQHKILQAIVKAQETNYHNLAVIISLLGSNENVQVLACEQLAQYVSVKSDMFIDKNILKLLLLVSGQPLYDSNQCVINVCEQLNWKISLGLHLWYLEPAFKSIVNVVQKYESAWSSDEAYCLPPKPHYAQEETDLKDLCYHLLVLYSQKSHSLVELLNPGTHTSNPLDYRLSWLMMQALKAIGYSHLDDIITTKYHIAFASQLLAYDMWEWAIFIFMHITDDDLRRHHIEEVIEKHVELCDSTNTLTDKEQFLIDNLKVPAEWIYKCKGHLAMYKHQFWDSCEYYLKATDYRKCHQVLFEKIVPSSVLNDQYEFIEDVLTTMHDNISEQDRSTWWRQGGEWLMNFFHIAGELSSTSGDIDMDAIMPLVYSFINELEVKYMSNKEGDLSYCCELFERILLLLKRRGHLIIDRKVIPVSPSTSIAIDI